MILECPNCDTKYEIQMAIPAGRKVRCAKCAEVWAPVEDVAATVVSESVSETGPELASNVAASGDEGHSNWASDSQEGTSGPDTPDEYGEEIDGAGFDDPGIQDNENQAVNSMTGPVVEDQASVMDDDGLPDLANDEAETSNDAALAAQAVAQNMDGEGRFSNRFFGRDLEAANSDQAFSPDLSASAPEDDGNAALTGPREAGSHEASAPVVPDALASAATPAIVAAAPGERGAGRTFVMGIAILTACVIGAGSAFAVFARERVVAYFPGTQAIYERFAPSSTPVASFEIKDVRARWDADLGRPVLKVSGHVHALNGVTVDPPSLVFSLKADNGEVLFTWAAKSPALDNGNGVYAFSETIPAPPKDVKRIRVRFGQAG